MRSKPEPDWTRDLFEDSPELFLSMLEERVAAAAGEVDRLLECLGEQGVEPRRVLDLNCGIGRHSVELARRGFDVVGTDLSPLYVKIAGDRAEKVGLSGKVRFRVADMRRIGQELRDEAPFDAVVNLFTSFGFYDERTNDEILSQCLNLVKAGGVFVLEIMNRDWIVRNFEANGFSCHMLDGKELVVLEERDFDAASSRMRSTWTYLHQQDHDNFVRKKKVTLDHRLWSLHELIEMFNRTGWRFRAVCHGFGDVAETKSMMFAKRFLFVAEKP
jgi:SAM-dependent methyltransferase